MERTRWTDELIDERMQAIDENFDRLFTELLTLRQEMHAGFSELRAEMVAFHRQVTLIVAGLAVALIGLLGAIVAQG